MVGGFFRKGGVRGFLEKGVVGDFLKNELVGGFCGEKGVVSGEGMGIFGGVGAKGGEKLKGVKFGGGGVW